MNLTETSGATAAVSPNKTVGKALGAPPPTTKELKSLKKACEQFEAVFAKQLLSEMRKGMPDTSIGDQAGSDIYKDMMDQAIGDSMARQGALGIGQMLYKEFAAQVAGSSTAPTQGTAGELGHSAHDGAIAPPG